MSDIPDDLMRELLKTFKIEAAEHLQTLNQTLLKMEQVDEDSERRELVQTAFRAAHSLKGAARTVDLPEIERLAHSLENTLQHARDTDTILEPKVCDVLYNILDGIQLLLEGQTVDQMALEERLLAVVSSSAQSSLVVTPSARAEMESDDGSIVTSPDETIRIAIRKLDELMAQTGELISSKINAEQRLTDFQALRQQLDHWPRAWREVKALLKHVKGEPGRRLEEVLRQHSDYLQRLMHSFGVFEQDLSRDTLRLAIVTTDLQDDVRRALMMPFQTLVLGMERAVRDAARVEGKQVVFMIAGGDIELDKKILEQLKDPLLHLLRNAVSHGIEIPEARVAVAKPTEGQVHLTVRQRGNEVSLTVKDDGNGFNLEALSQAGVASTSRPESQSTDDIISSAFLPGVTTTQRITAISGRGVGLDVVRQRIEDIHGRIVVNTVTGQGTTIELIVPSSLTMTRGLVVRVGNERFVLPLLSIERIVEVQDTFTVGGRLMLRLEQTSLPLISLAAVLQRPGSSKGPSTWSLAVIVGVAEQRLALQVDEVVSEVELVVKPLGEPLRRVRNVAGAALLGNGEPIIILNPGDLVRSARSSPVMSLQLEVPKQNEKVISGHILVVDDSITTRTLEKNILEAAGFRVTIATDGLEALKRLKEHAIDLVVTDVQMPNMDGIALTRQIRDTDPYKHLPVILVTSLESSDDRERGMLAGADAYIVKRGFSQATLMTTIQQFLQKVI